MMLESNTDKTFNQVEHRDRMLIMKYSQMLLFLLFMLRLLCRSLGTRGDHYNLTENAIKINTHKK